MNVPRNFPVIRSFRLFFGRLVGWSVYLVIMSRVRCHIGALVNILEKKKHNQYFLGYGTSDRPLASHPLILSYSLHTFDTLSLITFLFYRVYKKYWRAIGSLLSPLILLSLLGKMPLYKSVQNQNSKKYMEAVNNGIIVSHHVFNLFFLFFFKSWTVI